ncbi:MAG: alkaline phosphatase [Planctomycetaceae bacterium]|nr:alkaline phosphatase [Planctomycetales bacterium]MCB9927612.1 alkaline phosphatase [Planctomycetaceae bacterium]
MATCSRCSLTLAFSLAFSIFGLRPAVSEDHLSDLQTNAIDRNYSEAAHWGWQSKNYTLWGTHSNRLIPVYTYGTKDAGAGIDLRDYIEDKSCYRDAARLEQIYGYLPGHTVSPTADYMDQTDIFRIQQAALNAGRKYIFLVVFDGMDWQTTRAASIYNLHRVPYDEGRGMGTHFQEYMAGGTSQFGFMCTAPHNDGTNVDVDTQTVTNPGGKVRGGYDPDRGGPNPWTPGADPQYLVSEPKQATDRHAYTDSSSSATSMTAGIKTYNNAITLDWQGKPVRTIAHIAQARGLKAGIVTSVPISHATPASAYAHNVHRNDYQDITRDMLGLRSISHPDQPLAGLDVVIGGGYGEVHAKSSGQGKNFVPGNAYLTDEDLATVDEKNGGRYVVAQRTTGQRGGDVLARAASQAADGGLRLLGFYGIGAAKGHLPFQTANGDFKPVPGRTKKAEHYTAADIAENPTVAEMTSAALTVLQKSHKGFWLLVEPGDVDWANHDDNLDNSIGAVNSGDAAVKVITDWVETHSNWQESLVIVTADHGHYLFLDRPEMLAEQARAAR